MGLSVEHFPRDWSLHRFSTLNISRKSLIYSFIGNFDDISICVTNRLASLPGKAKLLGDAIPVECESLEVTDVE